MVQKEPTTLPDGACGKASRAIDDTEAGVKSGKRNNAQDRDRAYWEPPRAALGRIEGRIEEIGSDEPGPEPGPPPTRRQRLGRALWGRRSSLAVGLGVIAVLIAVVVMPGSHSQPAATPTTSPSEIAGVMESPSPDPFSSTSPTPSPTVSQTPMAIWTAPESTSGPVWTEPPAIWIAPSEPTPSPTPPVTNGWPVAIGDSPDQVVAGPDGTVYTSGWALNAAGHARNGWLQLPSGEYRVPVAFGSDGTIYVASDGYADDGNILTVLSAFAADGKLRAGWPVSFLPQPYFEPGPSGTLFVFSNVNDKITVSVLNSAGKTTATWTIGSAPSGSCGHVIRPDGTLFYALLASLSGQDCTVQVYSSTGKRLSKSPGRGWNGLTMAPDGTVVAVGYDLEPYSRYLVAQTRLAVMGTDGQPAAGWPVALEGTASWPSFGQDGSIYVAQGGLGTSPSKVVAFDAAGNGKAGWPVALPAGYGPFSDGTRPLSPVVGDDGTVYVAAINSSLVGYVMAFDPSGNLLPGWPYSLPQAFADPGVGYGRMYGISPGLMFVPSPSGGGLLYLALEGRIVALDRHGNVAPGWPYLLPGTQELNGSWFAWAATPDGGLVSIVQSSTEVGVVYVVLRLTPEGSLLH